MLAKIFWAKNSEAPIPNVETYDGRPLQIPAGDKATADIEEDQSFLVRLLNSAAIPWRSGSADDSVRPAGDVRGLRASQRHVPPGVFSHGRQENDNELCP